MINIGSPSVTALETSPTRSTLSLNNNNLFQVPVIVYNPAIK
jgi:hypothetical protein